MDLTSHAPGHPMSLDTWLIYLLATIGLSLSPGPNGLLALTHGALHGRGKAIYTILGGVTGFVIVIALSMFGIGALLKASIVWITVLKWVGGAYLVWLGIQVWRSRALRNAVLNDKFSAILRVGAIPDFSDTAIVIETEAVHDAVQPLLLQLARLGELLVADVGNGEEFAEICTGQLLERPRVRNNMHPTADQ